MPHSLFAPRIIVGIDPCFGELKKIAEEFQTTLAATAVQFVLTTKEDCAVVSCAGRERKWYVCKSTFPRLLKEDRCHGHSCAAQVGPLKKSDRSQLIEAGWWLEGYYHDHKGFITEEAVYFPKLQRSLSLLWLHDEI